jgi:hypothetical protein
MKKKLFALLSFILISCHIFSQVTEVDLFLKGTANPNVLAVGMKVISGSTTSMNTSRVLYSSQIGFVVPYGVTLSVSNKYWPLTNNVPGTGSPTNPATPPMNWSIFSFLSNPIPGDSLSYYTINSSPSPTAIFNRLAAGDSLILFEIALSVPSHLCISMVRLFENASDPSSSTIGFGGRDFNTALKIGSNSPYRSNYYPPITRIVSSVLDVGENSLRKICKCSKSGDTISLDAIPTLDTINISSDIIFDHNLTIKSNTSRNIKCNQTAKFIINPNLAMNFENLHIEKCLTSNISEIVQNNGILSLKNVRIWDRKLGLSNNKTMFSLGHLKVAGVIKIYK